MLATLTRRTLSFLYLHETIKATLSLHTLKQALEESLAEACQLGLESDWQREVAERLRQVDAEQERKRERLAELHRQTLAEEERLADTVRDVAGWKVRTTKECQQINFTGCVGFTLTCTITTV